MTKKHMFIVEDEEDILELLRYHLSRDGYTVTTATDGEEALSAIPKIMPDLVLLDLMLPGVDGLDVCRKLKKDTQTAAIPIIMVTAKGEESDIVTGLELGADDYVAKPFSMKVLIARVRTVLHRKGQPPADADATLCVRDLAIDPRRREVLVKGKPVDLTFTEFGLLRFLAGRPGWVMTRDQIIYAVRGEDYAVTDRAVDVQIVGLRKKLGKCADYIETVRGVGYRFKESG
ncbi:MAG: response regulator [Lentisphaerales bacterium]|nr:MAG: response regulator [Lentisphaerales bacterium]